MIPLDLDWMIDEHFCIASPPEHRTNEHA